MVGIQLKSASALSDGAKVLVKQQAQLSGSKAEYVAGELKLREKTEVCEVKLEPMRT